MREGPAHVQSWPEDVVPAPACDMSTFCQLVWARGLEQYRDLPWRRTHDPYAVWLSEVMLQQTQVSRVDGRWQHWLERFPTVERLAEADPADVLEEWQGMGYNRRALALLQAARTIVEAGQGFPSAYEALVSLPGIGPATAAGIRAFAFNLPGVYLETNVRTVFLHELYPDKQGVPDKRLVPLVAAACPDDARGWYFALLDYGAWLKKNVPNPSRRSRSHVRQSRFEGSHRQKRAQVIRLLLAARPRGIEAQEVEAALEVSADEARALLCELADEGFCRSEGEHWFV